jgi:hypothetical protein
MGHTPYGYRIENGQAVIDTEKAAQVKQIFDEYLSGTALCASARKAGLNMTHSSVKHLLTNKKYLGNEFYPAIINEEMFRRASEKITERAAMLGRDSLGPKEYIRPHVPVEFQMEEPERSYSDPFEQAAYTYSRIKEVKDGTG